MPIFLDASTSTDKTAAQYLSAGEYKFIADIGSSDAASIAVFHRAAASGTDMAVSKDGAAIALIEADPSKLVISGGEEFLVQRASGSAAVTVVAHRVSRNA